MTRFLIILTVVTVVTVGLAESAYAQAPDIYVDEDFSDWDARAPLHTDPQDQPGGGIDFGRLWVDNDDRFLFLSIEVGVEEISIQNGSCITLFLDTDNDPSTGQQAAGLGAELVWVFGARSGTFTSGGNTVQIDHDDIGLTPAPTVTSLQFELALDLDAEPRRLGVLFPSDTVGIAFEVTDGLDVIPDAGQNIRYVIDREEPERLYDFDLGREHDSDLRILSWNVERDGIFEAGRASAYRRLMTGIGPDIIGFTEIREHTAVQTLDLVESFLPSDAGEQWFGSGSSFDVIVTSRYEILRAFDLLRGSAGAYLIDTSDKIGTDLFLIVAHLRCCEADLARQAQIDELMAFVRDVQGDGTLTSETPIVIAGDMNFVGDSRQQGTLIRGEIVNPQHKPSFGPDWDGSPLGDARPLTTGLPATYTWPGRGEEFSPGRLDYVAFTDFVLELGNSYSLNTPTIPIAELTRLGMSASDTIVASDHNPIVTDFRNMSPTAVESDRSVPGSLADIVAYPNPSTGSFHLRFDADLIESLELDVVDILGRQVASVTHGVRSPGVQDVLLSLEDLPAGVYLVELKSASNSVTTSIVVRGR